MMPLGWRATQRNAKTGLTQWIVSIKERTDVLSQTTCFRSAHMNERDLISAYHLLLPLTSHASYGTMVINWHPEETGI